MWPKTPLQNLNLSRLESTASSMANPPSDMVMAKNSAEFEITPIDSQLCKHLTLTSVRLQITKPSLTFLRELQLCPDHRCKNPITPRPSPRTLVSPNSRDDLTPPPPSDDLGAQNPRNPRDRRLRSASLPTISILQGTTAPVPCPRTNIMTL